MALDEKETQEREDLELSRDRAKTVRFWLDTTAVALAVSLVASLLYATWAYAIPALKSWKEASDQTAAGYRDTLNAAAPKIVQMIDKADSVIGHLDGVTAQSERLMTGMADDIPSTLKGVQRVTGALERQVESNGSETSSLIANLNLRLTSDGGLIPTATGLISSLTKTADAFGVTVGELTEAVKMASEKTGRSLDAINGLLARPEIVEILKHLDGTSANVEQMSASAAEAMKCAPEIAESLNKIAKATSKFSKITLVANIISTLARAFIP
ncbi:MAG: hypothetical protein AB1631_23530 [Acidobacteriota bacterium]